MVPTSAEGAKALAKVLETNTSLTELQSHYNQIPVECAEASVKMLESFRMRDAHGWVLSVKMR